MASFHFLNWSLGGVWAWHISFCTTTLITFTFVYSCLHQFFTIFIFFLSSKHSIYSNRNRALLFCQRESLFNRPTLSLLSTVREQMKKWSFLVSVADDLCMTSRSSHVTKIIHPYVFFFLLNALAPVKSNITEDNENLNLKARLISVIFNKIVGDQVWCSLFSVTIRLARSVFQFRLKHSLLFSYCFSIPFSFVRSIQILLNWKLRDVEILTIMTNCNCTDFDQL